MLVLKNSISYVKTIKICKSYFGFSYLRYILLHGSNRFHLPWTTVKQVWAKIKSSFFFSTGRNEVNTFLSWIWNLPVSDGNGRSLPLSALDESNGTTTFCAYFVWRRFTDLRLFFLILALVLPRWHQPQHNIASTGDRTVQHNHAANQYILYYWSIIILLLTRTLAKLKFWI